MMTEQIYHSDLAIPPGEYLEEVIQELGITKDDLAKRMGRPPSKLSHIFNGKKSITPETALSLEKVVGVPAHIWTGLEEEYRLTLAKQKESKQDQPLKQETHLVTKFCYSQLVKLGVVEECKRTVDKVQALRRFFGTVSLNHIPSLRRYEPAFRVGKAGKRSPEATAAWIRIGERKAVQIDCEPYSKDRLHSSLNHIRSMTKKEDGSFVGELRKLLASCGIAFVLCPPLPNTKAHGATFWLNKEKAVLMISDRYKWADIFWFSLFHELGHIVLHDRKDVILEGVDHDRRESEADEFASNELIPYNEYAIFVQRGNLNERNIKAFAKKIGIHPGIVVGRLQHENRIRKNWLNGLRIQYEMVG